MATIAQKIKKAKAAIAKIHGEEVVMAQEEVDRIPVPLINLSENIGGGLPRGRMMEVFGFEGSGKTTLALEFVKAIQKEGPVLYVEPEHALDPMYVRNIGIDTDPEKWIYCSPTTMEECFTVIREFLKEDAIAGFVFDSLPAAPTAYELGKGEDGIEVAGQARVISSNLRKLLGYIKKRNVVAIFINHEKEDIRASGRGYTTTTTPGGRALKYYSSLRLRVRPGKSDYFEKDGIRSIIKVVKTKVGGVYQGLCEYHVQWQQGIVKQIELLDIGLRYGVIKRQGSWFVAGGQKFQGKTSIMKAIMKSKKLRAVIHKAAKSSS